MERNDERVEYHDKPSPHFLFAWLTDGETVERLSFDRPDRLTVVYAPPWWLRKRHRKRIGEQLARCLDTLTPGEETP